MTVLKYLPFLIYRDNSDSVLHLIAGLNSPYHDEKTLTEIAKIAEKIIAKGINVNNQNKNGLLVVFMFLYYITLNNNNLNEFFKKKNCCYKRLKVFTLIKMNKKLICVLC